MQGGDEVRLDVAREKLIHQSTEVGDCLRFGLHRAPTKSGHKKMMVFYEVDGVHRWAYRCWAGPIPEDKQVNHTCDVPDCIRVQHLYLGNQSQNVRDAVARGRYVKNRGGAKLTWEQVDEIRASVTTRTGLLAQKYGVSRYVIQDIRAGRAWVR